MTKQLSIEGLLFTVLSIVYFEPLVNVIGWIACNLFVHHDFLSYFISTSFFEKIRNSIFLSTTVAVGSVILGGLLTYFFYCLRSPWHRGGVLLMLLSFFAISPIIYLAALTRIHWFNQFPVFLQSVLVLWLNMTPLVALLFVFSLGSLGSASVESALMAAKPIPVLHHIIFPQIRFSMFSAFLIVFMLIFIHEEVPSFLGYRTYAEEFLARIVAMEDYREASLASLPFLFLGSTALLLISWMLMKFYVCYGDAEPVSLMRLHINTKKVPVTAGNIILFLVIGGLIFLLMKELDFAHMNQLIADNIDSIRNTFMLSVVNAITGVLGGGFLYRHFRRRSKSGWFIVWGAVMMFYWLTPSSLSILALVHLSQLIHCDSIVFDYFILSFGYLLRLLPISFILFSVIGTISTRRQDLFFKFIHVSAFNRFWKITFPLHWYKWMVISAVLAIFAMNEISATVLLVPPGVETIVVRIYNLMHYGDFSSVAFLSLMQFALVFICVITTQLMMRFHDTA